MSGIQLVAIVFAAGMLFLTYNSFRRRELRGYELVTWTVVWLGLAAISAFPDVVRGLIVPLRIFRLLDLVVILGLLGMSALVFVLKRPPGNGLVEQPSAVAEFE